MKLYQSGAPSYANALSSLHTTVRTNDLVSVIKNPQIVESMKKIYNKVKLIHIRDDIAFPGL